jgi:hypothetical protein
MAELGAKVRIPTTTNAISVDHDNWRSQGVPSSFGFPASRLAHAYLRMGCRPTYTCSPHLLDSAPKAGEFVGWSAMRRTKSSCGDEYADRSRLSAALEVELKELGMASLYIHYMSSAKLVELINSVDPNGEMVVSVPGSERLTIGKDPLKPTYVIDFSKEVVAPLDPTDEPLGPYSLWFEILGTKPLEFDCLGELLRGALRDIEKARPGTLDKLTQIQKRSKRIVAREKRLLFTDEQKGENLGAELCDGWFYCAHNNSQETRVWLERACKCAGLEWGKDFNTNI